MRWRAVLLASVLVAGSAALRAATGSSPRDGAVAGLEAWLDGTRDLTCRFEQRLLSGILGTGTREYGVLYLLRPGHLRWDYTRPEPKTAVVEGGRTLLYLPEDRQLIRGRLDPEQDLLPELLAGKGTVSALFEAEILSETGSGASRAIRLKLLPRAASRGVEEVVLTLSGPECSIERAEVLDPAGNRMEYLFTRVRRNTGLSESVFTFEAPPGTEIVDSP
jgi:outer membrane lipoprotein carrier protein